MHYNNIWQDKNLLSILLSGGVVVMPTDTIYGIVGRAEDTETVEKIYQLRRRSPDKSCIILIDNMDAIKKFGVEITSVQEKIILEEKDRPTSFILDCDNDDFKYLHRGLKTLAFRIPKEANLRALLKEVGPLIAPSANWEGELPAQNTQEAKKYFGDGVDLYIDGGEIVGVPSKIVRLSKNGTISIIRQ